MRVLIVDDSEDTVLVLSRLLKRVGHEVCVAADGEQAILLTADFRPHAVLLDISLPSMDGYEVAKCLRAVPGENRLRIVALSGNKSEPEREQAAGIDCHLLKPAGLNDILQAIGAHPLETLPAAKQQC